MSGPQDLRLIVTMIMTLVVVSSDNVYLKGLAFLLTLAWHLFTIFKRLKKNLTDIPNEGHFMYSREKDIYLLTVVQVSISWVMLMVLGIIVFFSRTLLVIGLITILLSLSVGLIIEYFLKRRSDVWRWQLKND
ncbi:hypothetical protein ERX37_05805 [Macrococcus hajekii]|uniref:Uncharacterized protein n=1 Tax=Macrococcus hajekii TaxID=198482 RepID=A0A4R6BJG4_9STAP|nr:hypothetical protein [Macrococcus hajekii]TDM01726.1 hypothetical protein ERX37_05805 [Macrococcus hajekii]